jgi:hypothetical protein
MLLVFVTLTFCGMVVLRSGRHKSQKQTNLKPIFGVGNGEAPDDKQYPVPQLGLVDEPPAVLPARLPALRREDQDKIKPMIRPVSRVEPEPAPSPYEELPPPIPIDDYVPPNREEPKPVVRPPVQVVQPQAAPPEWVPEPPKPVVAPLKPVDIHLPSPNDNNHRLLDEDIPGTTYKCYRSVDWGEVCVYSNLCHDGNKVVFFDDSKPPLSDVPRCGEGKQQLIVHAFTLSYP